MSNLIEALRKGGDGQYTPDPESKIEFTKAELAVIAFRPGDTAVIMFPGPVTPERAEELAERWKELVRPDVKCVVLGDGARLGVIRAVD